MKDRIGNRDGGGGDGKGGGGGFEIEVVEDCFPVTEVRELESIEGKPLV